MTNNLTKIASLPGSGGGSMSALPPEKNEAKPVEVPILKFFDPSWRASQGFEPWPPIEDEGPMVYVPSLGCFIPTPQNPLFKDVRKARIDEFKRAHKGCTSCLYIGSNPPVTLTADEYADGKCSLTWPPIDWECGL